MVDIHTHLIYDVDDGCQTIDESITMIKTLKELGFNKVIITPHYIANSEKEEECYSHPVNENIKKLNEIKELLIEENIDIEVYLGNEILIDNNLKDLLHSKKVSTLNNTKYILIELPFKNKIINLGDLIFEIKCKGYIPIIAHPERYYYFQDDYKLVDKLKEQEILFQSNFTSIDKTSSKGTRKLFKYLLKNQYVDYLATDIHLYKNETLIKSFSKMVKKIKKITGEDYYNTIIQNSEDILNK